MHEYLLFSTFKMICVNTVIYQLVAWITPTFCIHVQEISSSGRSYRKLSRFDTIHLEYKKITLKTQLLKLRLALEIASITTKGGCIEGHECFIKQIM